MDDREREVHNEGEAGYKGGAAEAYMPAAIPVAAEASTPLTWTHWGSVLSGLAVVIALTALLTALGAGIGLRLLPIAGGGGLAYWIVGSTIVSLFVGSMLANRFARVANVSSGIWHGVLIWSLMLILNIIGVFGTGPMGMPLFVSRVGAMNVTGALPTLAAVSWWFFISSVLGLIAAILGGAAGVKETEAGVHEHPRHERHA